MKAKKVYRSVAELPRVYVPVEEVMKNYAAEAAEADRRYGPHVPPLTPRGRPRKGTKVEGSKVHSVRLGVSVWAVLERKAKALRITPNAAVQLAVREWAERAGR